MKIRHIVFGALTAFCLAASLILSCCRLNVTDSNVRDFAAENFRGRSNDRYVQLAVYLNDEDYLTPDGMMQIKNTLESKLVENGIVQTSGYLLSGSAEKAATLSRDTLSIDVISTVYFGDWFGLHPHIPIFGGYVDESAATTDFCVIDDLAAWRIFGSTDVCGMDVKINEKLYTISAVLAADRGTYAEYYGEKPRVYILYNSAAMRDERITFTSLEAVLPEPVEGAAYSMLKEAVASYSDEIYTVTDRFSPRELFENIKEFSSLGVMEGKSFPYYENVARIMETKCASILVFESAFYILAAIFFITLLVLIVRPWLNRMKERRLVKKRHAIY